MNCSRVLRSLHLFAALCAEISILSAEPPIKLWPNTPPGPEPELEAAIQKCLNDGNVSIIVNGKDLNYISSAGLGVFMAYIEEIRELDGDIKIAELAPRVFNVFDLLGFPVLFDIVRTEEEATERFSNPADRT